MATESADKRELVPIGDDPAELAALADAVVRGCTIRYARIKNLRRLIEAVQAHSQARVAPARSERPADWRPPVRDNAGKLTELVFQRSEVIESDCEDLDVRVTLHCPVHFVLNALFERASFAGDAWFGEASFSGTAFFEETRFSGDAVFFKVRFGRSAFFDHARFAGAALFNGTRFADEADFFAADFANAAMFETASFAGFADFSGARFGGAARFSVEDFSGGVRFDEARFLGEVEGDLRPCFLRTATFAEGAVAAKDGSDENEKPVWLTRSAMWIKALPVRVLRAEKRWAQRRFRWETVRGLGQLAILSRVSLFALIAIPVVVAFWPAVRASTGAYHRGLAETHSSVNRVLDEIDRAVKHHPGALGDHGARLGEVLDQAARASYRWSSELESLVAESPHIGATLALTFFAAVAVTLGLFVYQVWAPDDIRKHDIDAFVDRAHQRYPENASDRDDGLRRAIDHLETIAKRRPDRHASFVTHHGDTIWVPPRDRIDWFEDLADETSSSATRTGEHAADGKRTPAGSSPASGGEDERDFWSNQEFLKWSGVVPGAERRRVVIEEGAKAEYWLKSRERIGAAAVSFGFYLVGVVFLLFILGIQIGKVWRATGW